MAQFAATNGVEALRILKFGEMEERFGASKSVLGTARSEVLANSGKRRKSPNTGK
jgi:hypothetical protein